MTGRDVAELHHINNKGKEHKQARWHYRCLKRKGLECQTVGVDLEKNVWRLHMFLLTKLLDHDAKVKLKMSDSSVFKELDTRAALTALYSCFDFSVTISQLDLWLEFS